MELLTYLLTLLAFQIPSLFTCFHSSFSVSLPPSIPLSLLYCLFLSLPPSFPPSLLYSLSISLLPSFHVSYWISDKISSISLLLRCVSDSLCEIVITRREEGGTTGITRHRGGGYRTITRYITRAQETHTEGRKERKREGGREWKGGEIITELHYIHLCKRN